MNGLVQCLPNIILGYLSELDPDFFSVLSTLLTGYKSVISAFIYAIQSLHEPSHLSYLRHCPRPWDV